MNKKFRVTVERRTNNVLEAIRILGNLCNKSRYDYTEDEVNKIFKVIKLELKITKRLFKREKKDEFEL